VKTGTKPPKQFWVWPPSTAVPAAVVAVFRRDLQVSEEKEHTIVILFLSAAKPIAQF
jgi:hypothetical protein